MARSKGLDAECDPLGHRESESYKSPKPAIPGSSPGCPLRERPTRALSPAPRPFLRRPGGGRLLREEQLDLVLAEPGMSGRQTRRRSRAKKRLAAACSASRPGLGASTMEGSGVGRDRRRDGRLCARGGLLGPRGSTRPRSMSSNRGMGPIQATQRGQPQESQILFRAPWGEDGHAGGLRLSYPADQKRGPEGHQEEGERLEVYVAQDARSSRSTSLAVLQLADRVTQRLREVERDQRRLVAIPTLHDVADLGDHRVGVVGRLSVGAD